MSTNWSEKKTIENQPSWSLGDLSEIIKSFQVSKNFIDGKDLSEWKKSENIKSVLTFLIELLEEISKINPEKEKIKFYLFIRRIIDELNNIYSLNEKIKNNDTSPIIRITNKYKFENIEDFIQILKDIIEKKDSPINCFSENKTEDQSILAKDSYNKCIKSVKTLITWVRKYISDKKICTNWDSRVCGTTQVILENDENEPRTLEKLMTAYEKWSWNSTSPIDSIDRKNISVNNRENVIIVLNFLIEVLDIFKNDVIEVTTPFYDELLNIVAQLYIISRKHSETRLYDIENFEKLISDIKNISTNSKLDLDKTEYNDFLRDIVLFIEEVKKYLPKETGGDLEVSNANTTIINEKNQ